VGLTIGIWLTYRISGGSLNPAVNLGLLIAGKMDTYTFLGYTVAQLAGSTAACGVVSIILPGEFKGANQLFGATSVLQGIVLEVVLTMILVLIVFFIAVEKSKATFLAPLIIGLYSECRVSLSFFCNQHLFPFIPPRPTPPSYNMYVYF
jgi:aquaporin related protein